MSSSLSCVVIGSINADLVVRVPRVPLRGENLKAHDVLTGCGGKGLNCAIAMARLGGSAQMIGSVGTDAYGDQAIGALRAEGVGTEGIQCCDDAATGLAVILVDDAGENTIVVGRGANDRLRAQDVRLALADAGPDLIVTNYEVPFACVQAALDWGDAHGVLTVCDAGPARHQLPERWGSHTVLTGNEDEIACLFDAVPEDDDVWKRGIQGLVSAGLLGVVVKLGARGAYLHASNVKGCVPAFDVPVVDTTGAGDASTAALALGLARGMPWREAVRYANAAGAVAVTRLGAADAMPHSREVEALLARL